MSQSDEQNFCTECYKKYPDANKYQTHMRMKHKQSKSANVSHVGNGNGNNVSEEEIWEMEEKINAYLGELSEEYPQNAKPSQSQNLLEEQRFIGQANYLPNAIVRTPYEPQIDVLEEMPSNYDFHPLGPVALNNQQLEQLKKQIKQEVILLYGKLKEERNYWQYADPFDQKINFQEEFSVLDVPKMIKNYPKRGLHLRIPELTIFLVWIARVCKPDMFKLLFEMLVSYNISYESYLKAEKIPKTARRNLKTWSNFASLQRKNSADKTLFQGLQLTEGQNCVSGFSLHINAKKINVKQLQKFLDLYVGWAEVVLPMFGMEKKSEGN